MGSQRQPLARGTGTRTGTLPNHRACSPTSHWAARGVPCHFRGSRDTQARQQPAVQMGPPRRRPRSWSLGDQVTSLRSGLFVTAANPAHPGKSLTREEGPAPSPQPPSDKRVWRKVPSPCSYRKQTPAPPPLGRDPASHPHRTLTLVTVAPFKPREGRGAAAPSPFLRRGRGSRKEDTRPPRSRSWHLPAPCSAGSSSSSPSPAGGRMRGVRQGPSGYWSIRLSLNKHSLETPGAQPSHAVHRLGWGRAQWQPSAGGGGGAGDHRGPCRQGLVLGAKEEGAGES